MCAVVASLKIMEVAPLYIIVPYPTSPSVIVQHDLVLISMLKQVRKILRMKQTLVCFTNAVAYVLRFIVY